MDISVHHSIHTAHVGKHRVPMFIHVIVHILHLFGKHKKSIFMKLPSLLYGMKHSRECYMMELQDQDNMFLMMCVLQVF